MELLIPPNDRLQSAQLLGVVLVLQWADGHRGELELGTMRRHCPCAECGGQPAPKGGLNVLSPTGKNELRGIQPIGRYALQLFWADGHATGIYSFDLLRELCECPDCGGAGAE